MVGPFMYLVDIIKDSLQLTILLISIGNIQNVIQHPTSFSSAVSNVIFVFVKYPVILFSFSPSLFYSSHFSYTYYASSEQSGSRQAVIRQSSGSHQAVIRQSSGCHQAVIRQSAERQDHQFFIIFLEIS